MPRTYRVGVVGFGVAGAATAYLLARDGHTVTLLERAPRLGAYGAGILLQCSGQLVLEQLGLLAPVLARAAPVEELHARHAGGGTLIRTVYGDYAPGCRAYGVHRGVMFNVLHMNRYVANLIAIGVVTAWNFWVNSKVSWSGTGASR